jgi:large subunit ribosomal protein L17
MGHRDKTVKLNITSSHRNAMFSNMATSLLEHRIIRTTDSKAKALKPIVDRIIATAKEDSLHARRMVARTVNNKEVLKKLFSEIVPQFRDRSSGFSRVIKLGVRRGDGAPISVVELLIDKPITVEDSEKGKGKKGKASKSAKAVKSKKIGVSKTKKAAAKS